MILPVYAYGSPVLRKKGVEIDRDYPGLDALIENMFETMENSSGVGLAAPQIGKAIRLFIVDTSGFAEMEGLTEQERKEVIEFKKVFINAYIEKEEGEVWSFNEGCLSIPDIHEDVKRPEIIHIRYMDEQFNEHKETYKGIMARVIQHEYDHTEGIMFTDRLSSFKKRLLKRKLENISKGKIRTTYPMKFPRK